jgi:predicted ATPase
MDRFVVISGCSGGGKSVPLDALRRRGCAVVREPARRIVARELQCNGFALPSVNAVAFARETIDLSLADRAAAERCPGLVFFDRGLIEAAAALQHLTGEPIIDELRHTYRYSRHVFLTPPWPEIYKKNRERRHGLSEAAAEYDRLCKVYPFLGYESVFFPKLTLKAVPTSPSPLSTTIERSWAVGRTSEFELSDQPAQRGASVSSVC